MAKLVNAESVNAEGGMIGARWVMERIGGLIGGWGGWARGLV